MSNSINQKFNTLTLLKFAMPSIIMMVFMSCYTIVDGIFVSRFVGSDALSSVNIVYPVVGIVVAVATMIATGGNAIISKSLGEGKNQEAREYLTQFVVFGVMLSVALIVIVFLFLTPICKALGANELLLEDCKNYLKIIILFGPACTLQTLFQSYLVTAGKPNLGLILMIGAGILNGALDYLFIVPMGMRVSGAALATGIGQSLPAVVGLFYFFASRKKLHFVPFKVRWKAIGMACYNGSSEMIGQLSNSIVTFLFNIILMRLAGAHGVAAITIILYGQFLFNAFYLGFSIGISPVIGFQYGAGQKENLKNVYKISMIFTLVTSVIMMIISVLSADGIVSIFTKEKETYQLASLGFQIFSVNFLFSGANIMSSGIFTALSNGKISAIISFSRTLVFLVISLLVFPQIMGVTGVWVAVPVAEFVTLLLCILMHRKYFWMNGEKKYI